MLKVKADNNFQQKAESYCCPSKQAKHVRITADRTIK